ncbi:hypothetical protein [Microbacterium arborescens]|uniref:hypothetical protein n=1 Tax=Microbacterium arborescens TaxID=33883 RepID=UPI000DF7C2CA|nr:hypothetical protein [Microbacterium arborescens]
MTSEDTGARVDGLARALCAIETRSKAATLEEVADGIQRWTRHRYEAAQLLDELRDHGFDVQPVLTQPTDNKREALALTIARTMPGWNEDTSEPPRPGMSEALRSAAEQHWQRVNAECLRQGRIFADAIMASPEWHDRHRGPLACNLCGRAYPHTHPVEEVGE